MSAPSLGERDRLLTQLQGTGAMIVPNGWTLWHLVDLVETLGIDTKEIELLGNPGGVSVVVAAAGVPEKETPSYD